MEKEKDKREALENSAEIPGHKKLGSVDMEKTQGQIQGLEVLTKAIEISSYCVALSFQLQERLHDSRSEQLKLCALNIYKNVAHSIEAITEWDFFNSLSSAKKSLFATAHIILILKQNSSIPNSVTIGLFNELNQMIQTISQFEKSSLYQPAEIQYMDSLSPRISEGSKEFLIS